MAHIYSYGTNPASIHLQRIWSERCYLIKQVVPINKDTPGAPIKQKFITIKTNLTHTCRSEVTSLEALFTLQLWLLQTPEIK